MSNFEYFWDRRIFYRPYENTQRVHKLNIKFWPQIAGRKRKKIAHQTKNWIFSKSKISIHQSNHGKRNIKQVLVWPYMLRRTAVNCARKLETWKIKNCVKSWLCTGILSKIRLDTLFGSKQHYLSIFRLVFLRKRVFDFLIFAKNHEKCHFPAIFGKFSCLYEALGDGRNFYMTQKNFGGSKIW